MSEDIRNFLIDPARIHSQITVETRTLMSDMLEFDSEDQTGPEGQDGFYIRKTSDLLPESAQLIPIDPPQLTSVSKHISSLIPTLVTIISRVLQDLELNITRLLSLNPSRRDSIAQHLHQLSGLTIPQNGPGRAESGSLRKWVEGPRSTSQNAALKTYFEEVAVIALGQALLLKSWADRGLRPWTFTDLGRLNWALSTTLKPCMPLDREGWQITRPNLYSWYNPGVQLQHEIWNTLDKWELANEGPSSLIALMGPVRRAQAEIRDPSGYDPRFFQALWEQMAKLGFSFSSHTTPNGIQRNKTIFTPTLRDGRWIKTAPTSLAWIGLESSPFHLMVAELLHVWWGPVPPPLWTTGTGLEVHNRDQLALGLAMSSPKPSVVSRIAEMEACDAAFVLEEHTIRGQTRTSTGLRFRELVDSLPYFKKLRAAGTSLGGLQACIALSKLRPGGLLFWLREEALCTKDGTEMLNFLLDRAKLVCEWDFSELEHSLPAAIPLYPRHLYLFQREPNLETRLSHRPTRHSIHGQMRSHVELTLVLEDSLQADSKHSEPRGHWTVISHASPTSQRDWMEKWPDPTSQSIIRQLDQLRSASLPLANFTTIRHTPEGDSSQEGAWSVPLNLRGFWLHADYREGRKLRTQPLPRPGEEANDAGFLVLVSNESWVAPLSLYLMSDLIQKWLDYHVERRGGRWILNEQIVKWIPIPKALLRTLGVPNAQDAVNPPPSLDEKWKKLLAEIAYQPKVVQEALSHLDTHEANSESNNESNPSSNAELNQNIHSTVFIHTARALDYLQSGQNRLLSLVTQDGKIRWRELLEILPKAERVSISVHPRIRLSGSLPPHLPIGKMDRVKMPAPGILLATESGFNLHIGADSSLLISLIWDQLEGLKHPTWNELIQHLQLPRKLELAESTAFEVLRSYSEQSGRLQDLRNLLASCHIF